jgi:hypothetical protein
LSVNLALAPVLLRTSHPSPWAFVTFGDFLGGGIGFEELQIPVMRVPDAGDVLLLRSGVGLMVRYLMGRSTNWKCFYWISRGGIWVVLLVVYGVGVKSIAEKSR